MASSVRFDEIVFGQSVTHDASGFTGVVTGKAQYQNGNECVFIEGSDSTGRPIAEWQNVKDCVLSDE